MLDPKQLDDLARRLAESMPEGLKVLREDLSRGFRSTLETGLGRLDLVTREEFDVQAAVLARTRAKLDALATRVAELEATAAPTGSQQTQSSAADAAQEPPSA
jgi:BMFP domain-containing protein YqiC